MEIGPSPFHADRQLLHIGLRADELRAALPGRNIVLLVDTSGSMQAPDKLPLLQAAMKLLVRQLGPDDRLGIVTYAGHAGVALEPVPGGESTAVFAQVTTAAPASAPPMLSPAHSSSTVA